LLLENDLKAAPGREAVQVELASGLAATGQTDRAQLLLREVLAKNPASLTAAIKLAVLEFTKQNQRAAIQILNSSMQAAGAHQNLHLTLAEMQFAAKNHGEAEKHFRAVLAQDSNSRRAKVGLSLLLAERGDKLEEAEQLATDLYSRQRGDMAARDALGIVQLKRGNTQAAMTNLAAVAKANPKEALFRYHFGQALAASGDKQSAKKEFEAALGLQPQVFLAERIRAFL
jgi:predicted Zn-dependent protease